MTDATQSIADVCEAPVVFTPQNKPQLLSDLFASVPAPETLVILSKGPSLDQYRREWAAYPHVALNEVIECLPGDYGLYLDAVFAQLNVPSFTALIRERRHEVHHGGRGYVFDRDWFAGYGYHPGLTAVTAVNLAAIWGVKRLVFVGFDGLDGVGEQRYARCIRRILQPASKADYANVNPLLLDAIEAAGIESVWFHRQLAKKE